MTERKPHHHDARAEQAATRREANGPEGEAQELDAKRLGRRRFLKATGAFIVGAGLAGCEPEAQAPLGLHPAEPRVPQPAPRYVPRLPERVRGQYPAVPDTPTAPPEEGVLRFFTLHEANTVEAVTARILPGTPEDPGAREAGVVYYIDNMLAYDNPFAEATYRLPPFAETYQGDAPPEGQAERFEVVWIAEDQVERYGYQSIHTPRDVYRAGLASLDRFAAERFGGDFVELSEAQQDELVGAMLDGEATGFEDPSGESFFHVLRRHTCEGLFSDPVYGGNRGLAGWLLIGYPGAQRAYTEADIRAEGTSREPQGIVDMHRFHSGQDANEHVILPVSGSRLGSEHEPGPNSEHGQTPAPPNGSQNGSQNGSPSGAPNGGE